MKNYICTKAITFDKRENKHTDAALLPGIFTRGIDIGDQGEKVKQIWSLVHSKSGIVTLKMAILHHLALLHHFKYILKCQNTRAY